ncbi:MAG: hypothetical protein AAF363_12670 [Bacteroidota bacterium]
MYSLIICLSLISNLTTDQFEKDMPLSLEDIRYEYYLAVNEPKQSKALLKKLNQLDSEEPLINAYRAATEALFAVLTINPFSQISILKKSNRALDKALEADPDNTEIHFLRFAVQSSIPRFLGMSGDLDEDKTVLLDNASQLQSIQTEVKEFIVWFLGETDIYSEGELNQIKEAVM